MRGKAIRRIHIVHDDGITPAYAGKRRWLKILDQRIRDHPRVCGEKNFK